MGFRRRSDHEFTSTTAQTTAHRRYHVVFTRQKHPYEGRGHSICGKTFRVYSLAALHDSLFHDPVKHSNNLSDDAFLCRPVYKGDNHMAVRYRQDRRRKPLELVLMDTVLMLAFGLMLGTLIGWLGINWITGCGEYTLILDSKEIIHGECVAVPWRN